MKSEQTLESGRRVDEAKMETRAHGRERLVGVDRVKEAGEGR